MVLQRPRLPLRARLLGVLLARAAMLSELAVGLKHPLVLAALHLEVLLTFAEVLSGRAVGLQKHHLVLRARRSGELRQDPGEGSSGTVGEGTVVALAVKVYLEGLQLHLLLYSLAAAAAAAAAAPAGRRGRTPGGAATRFNAACDRSPGDRR